MDYTKIEFKSKEKAEQFIARYSDEMIRGKGYSPVRAYFDEASQSWKVTSHYYNGKIVYLQSLQKDGDSLNLPHNCTPQYRDKVTLKRLLYDIDTQILKVIEFINKGAYSRDLSEVELLQYYVAFTRELAGEDAHKSHIYKFMTMLWKMEQDNALVQSVDKIAAYFNRKRDCYLSSRTEQSKDETIMTDMDNFNRIFYLAEKAMQMDAEDKKFVAKKCRTEAETLFAIEKVRNVCPYKVKQAAAILTGYYQTEVQSA